VAGFWSRAASSTAHFSTKRAESSAEPGGKHETKMGPTFVAKSDAKSCKISNFLKALCLPECFVEQYNCWIQPSIPDDDIC
jgi:hypothetical protein